MSLWPENTMVAFQGAVDLGYRYLETDLHATADGVLVCVHDDTLDRTTEATGPVTQRHLADLQSFDAAYRFDPVRHFPHRCGGVTIPTFEELVTTFPDVRITVDLKQSGIEPLLADAVARWDLWDRLIVGSFRDGRIARFRRLTKGRVATSGGPAAILRFLAAVRMGRRPRLVADALQVPVSSNGLRVVDNRTVRAAHAIGKHVHVWTVNERDEMERLMELGVDGLITDRPDVLKHLMVERGRGGPWNEVRT